MASPVAVVHSLLRARQVHACHGLCSRHWCRPLCGYPLAVGNTDTRHTLALSGHDQVPARLHLWPRASGLIRLGVSLSAANARVLLRAGGFRWTSLSTLPDTNLRYQDAPTGNWRKWTVRKADAASSSPFKFVRAVLTNCHEYRVLGPGACQCPGRLGARPPVATTRGPSN